MNKGERAKELFLSGYNCSAAVALAFAEELGLEKEKIEKLVIGFGGGFGRQRLVCGAVSGMTFVLSGVLSDGKDKLLIYTIIRQACDEFKKQLGSLVCAELLDGVKRDDSTAKPDERTAEYYKKRPCAEICYLAADIAEKIICREREKK